MAYPSDESGAPEIHVQAFPVAEGKIRVSVDGGTQVRWRRDGRELFYIASDNRLMVVPIDTSTRTEPRIGAASALVSTRIYTSASPGRQQYFVSHDGQRFLLNVAMNDGNTLPITLLLNWSGNKGLTVSE